MFGIGIQVVVVALPAKAQDCRIYTVVYDARTPDPHVSAKSVASDTRPIIGRNLSLFHAGKVYDYLDTVGEVTVFEPAREGFTIVSRSHKKIAWVTFSELQRRVAEAEERASAHCLVLGASKDPLRRRELEWTRFQLAPDFTETWNADRQQLHLTSSLCEYRVRCAAPEALQFVDSFARYADWTARLNYLLHPQALAPGPRMRLNASLRRHRVLPIEVDLMAAPRQQVRLCAKHSLVWSLDGNDRAMIFDFESMLNDSHFERVSFSAFQRVALEPQTVSQSSASRSGLR